jgi:gas vesicle protein
LSISHRIAIDLKPADENEHDGGTNMDNQNVRHSGHVLFITFLGGVVVGAIAGILLTDKSGQETRWELEDYAKKKLQDLIKAGKEVRGALDDVIERSKTFVTNRQSDVQAAITAGKEAIRETRENRST